MKRRELEAHADIAQIAGFSRHILVDGMENGVEIIEMRSGNGLRVGVCPSRGLDIVFAELNGVNLTWRHPNGAIHPAFGSENNFGWLRGAPSGLVTTCGLESFGPPCEIEGETWGLHDRISYLPARAVSAQTLWHEEECGFRLAGSVRQTRLFGANLSLERAISVNLGQNRLVLRDTIRNDGFQKAPFCVLYHCNFGFPLVEAGAQLSLDSLVTPRDAPAQNGLENWARIEAPTAGFQEQVFFHELRDAKTGRVSLWNARRNVGVAMRFSRAHLPFFTQWKMLGAGAYVLGLEPSNAPLVSRKTLLERGQMPFLEAGESREFGLEFEFWSENYEK